MRVTLGQASPERHQIRKFTTRSRGCRPGVSPIVLRWGDHFWNKLLAGGKAEQCGWLRDRYGLSWQIVPTVFYEMLKDSNRARAKRVTEAMLKMVKFDIAGLKKAYEGA